MQYTRVVRDPSAYFCKFYSEIIELQRSLKHENSIYVIWF